MAGVAGPPLAGVVVDILQDTDTALLLAGTVMASSSLCFTLSAMAARRREARMVYSQL